MDDSALEAAPWTDAANARRLATRYADRLRWVPERRDWLAWAGSHWTRDTGGVRAMQAARDTAGAIFAEVAALDTEEARKQGGRWALASHQHQRLQAMLAQAQSHPDLVVPMTALDASPWVLACPNGTLDLKTGRLRPPSSADLITRVTGIPYMPEISDPRWAAALVLWMPDLKLRDYVQ